MANWQHTLDLKDLWKQYDKGEETIKVLGGEVAKLLRGVSLPEQFSDEVEEIAFGFEQVEDVEEFDNTLEQLYDLADTPLPTPAGQMQRKLLWVATTF